MPPPSCLLPTGVDSHAHIFRHDLPLASHRRYSPNYNATVEQYIGHLDHCGISHGVLVQPSFLGTDNHYLVSALRQHPDRLRGTVVVERDISEGELDDLHDAGVVGVRLNLVGQALEDYRAAPWQTFFGRLARRKWSVEIQRNMQDLHRILPSILASGVTVVLDHFGLPDSEIDPANTHHRALLSLLNREDIWVKLSATYRSQASLTQARVSLNHLREAYGHSNRLVWGSDWPHTRFEDKTTYRTQFSLMQHLLPDAHEQRRVMIDNPGKLFHIGQIA